jgi:60 kDa SS-A/Ro ribonucleoprotein
MPWKYLRHLITSGGQSDKLPGMVENSAGGAAYPVDDWTRLERFLVLGSEGGSYYASERKLTREGAQAVIACLMADGPAAVEAIVAVSDAGRAPKNDPAIFALALAAASENEHARTAALAALPKVCRTGTHLFQFAEAVNGLRGWGRGLRRAVAHWYLDRPVDALAYQAVKYKQREGWSHRDLLRLAHPAAGEGDAARRALFDWMCARETDASALPDIVRAHDAAQVAASVDEIVALIREHSLPREAIPSQWMDDREVWSALLAAMPMTAMIRTLNRMTAAGLLAPMSEASAHVAARIQDATALAKARVHPLALLIAQATYAGGHGVRGKLAWDPVVEIVDALDRAFYLAFEQVEPTGKRILQALDVSGSMSAGMVAGSPLTPRDASAAMALVTTAVERNVHTIAFTAGGDGFFQSPNRPDQASEGVIPFPVSSKQRLDDVVKRMAGMPFGGTDCALPMLYALERGIAADAFIVYTDSETWAGAIHPSVALKQYRERTGIPAKLVVVGMVANGFSIADPNDGGMLDVVGFDTATPAVIADFIRG